MHVSITQGECACVCVCVACVSVHVRGVCLHVRAVCVVLTVQLHGNRIHHDIYGGHDVDTVCFHCVSGGVAGVCGGPDTG